MRILPVIHHLDRATSMEQAAIAFDAGADGVFVISHHFDTDDVLLQVAAEVKAAFPSLRVGLNLLGRDVMVAAHAVASCGLDMVWGDACGVSSQGLSATGRHLFEFANANPAIEIFAAVAFKYQAIEPAPALAASAALSAGFIATTSGSATGVAAPIEKIASMSLATRGTLAIASGMSCENVGAFAPYLSHILVATGVSQAQDEHHFDFELMRRFVGIARLAA